jgi:hypothetical protein
VCVHRGGSGVWNGIGGTQDVSDLRRRRISSLLSERLLVLFLIESALVELQIRDETRVGSF